MGIQLQIETTTACDKKCNWCPLPELQPTRAHGLMPLDLFTEIIDEAATIPEIEQLCITGLGETLLDGLLVPRVAYARERLQGRPIEIFTNGSFLTPERFAALRDAGVSSVVISINAVRADQHHRVMGGRRNFDAVVANAESAVAHRGAVEVEVRAVYNADTFTLDDAGIFYAKWGHSKLGGHGQVVHEHNWAGDNRTLRELRPSDCCQRAVGQIYVMFNGKVTTCCLDPVGKLNVFGDLSRQGLRSVYNDPAYVRFREAHWANRADEFPYCKACLRV